MDSPCAAAALAQCHRPRACCQIYKDTVDLGRRPLGITAVDTTNLSSKQAIYLLLRSVVTAIRDSHTAAGLHKANSMAMSLAATVLLVLLVIISVIVCITLFLLCIVTATNCFVCKYDNTHTETKAIHTHTHAMRCAGPGHFSCMMALHVCCRDSAQSPTDQQWRGATPRHVRRLISRYLFFFGNHRRFHGARDFFSWFISRKGQPTSVSTSMPLVQQTPPTSKLRKKVFK